MTMEETRNLTQILIESFFSLAKGSDFFLSLVVKSGLKTPVMGIAWPASLDKDCFDMLKSI